MPAHDADYYCGWARRTLEFARDAGRHASWLARLCDQADELADCLLAAPRTVAHGEFYAENILVHDRRIAPVDWETAAVAAGEIDLASLTEGWPAAIVHRCEDEYRRARWPSGPPHDFERTLAAARIHWSLRWLGDRPEWHDHEGLRWRFPILRRLAETAGLI